MKLLFITIFSAFLVSCAPVQQLSHLSQPTNTQLVAGVGDTVLNISKEKNLPNAFGASDIFGRKTPTGMTTVQYLGIRNNKAIFKRKSIVVETGATTMNSTPLIIQNSSTTTHSGMVGGTMYSGTSTTALPPTVIPAQTPQAQVLDQGTMEVSVDLNKKKRELIVDGKTIVIEKADNNKLVYSILSH
jgi:hypothetical protein